MPQLFYGIVHKIYIGNQGKLTPFFIKCIVITHVFMEVNCFLLFLSEAIQVVIGSVVLDSVFPNMTSLNVLFHLFI